MSENNLQEDLKEIAQIYTHLTNLMLEYGYAALVEQVKSTTELDCIENVLRALEIINTTLVDIPATHSPPDARANTFSRPPGRLNYSDPQPTAHSRELAKLHSDKVLGTVDNQKLKKMIENNLMKGITDSINAAIFPSQPATSQVERFKKYKNYDDSDEDIEIPSLHSTRDTSVNVEHLNLEF
jgi:hypothetical protein